MNKFIFKTFLFFSILVLGYMVLSFWVNRSARSSNDYISGIIDKHGRINEINESKLILAGGSNLAFGINSKKLQEEFAVPVANLGLHAGLGLEFITNELKASIRKGDVVIISVEYFLGNGSYDLQSHAESIYPEASAFYTKNNLKDISLHIEKTRKNLKSINQLKIFDNSVYSRKGFNQFGDVVSHLEKAPPKKINDRSILPYRYWEGIEVLNDFYTYAQSKSVNVFFIYPNYPKSEYERNHLSIQKLHQDILKNLSIEVLSVPQDFVFNDDQFFDTVYHLNRDGRELRTDKLIELIKANTNVQKCLQKIRVKAVNQ